MLVQESVQYLTISAERAGQRLDNFLLNHWQKVPKGHIYRLLRTGQVRVNKGRVKAQYRLAEGDCLRLPPIRLVDKAEPGVVSQAAIDTIEQAILHEDEYLLVVNKPAGLAVHGGSGLSYGLIELLRQARPYAPMLELVHRLDKDTSGCILIAKKRKTLQELHELLRTHQVEKNYLALVEGKWPRFLREVDSPLRKNVLASGERIVKVDAQGKPSLTRFQVNQRLAGATLLNCSPVTGRTHQIRVHCAENGHAIIGDNKYGQKAERLYLHASEVIFSLPHRRIAVRAPLDEKFRKKINELQNGKTL